MVIYVPGLILSTVKIQSSGGLSDAEIKRMIQDAEVHKAQDENRKIMIESRNQAEGLIYETEKNLEQFKVTSRIPSAYYVRLS